MSVSLANRENPILADSRELGVFIALGQLAPKVFGMAYDVGFRLGERAGGADVAQLDRPHDPAIEMGDFRVCRG